MRALKSSDTRPSPLFSGGTGRCRPAVFSHPSAYVLRECPGTAPAAVTGPAMIVILGGGPAGRLASIRLASAGKQVTLVEHGGIGGQCLHSGCMPVCALNDVARLIHCSPGACMTSALSIQSLPRIFRCSLQRWGRSSRRSPRSLTRRRGLPAWISSTERPAGLRGRTAWAGDEDLKADAVIAATGSRPFVPEIPGIDLPGVFTSQTLPGMKKLPAEDGHHRGQRGGRGVRLYLLHLRVRRDHPLPQHVS